MSGQVQLSETEGRVVRVPATWAGKLGSTTWTVLAALATLVTICTPIVSVIVIVVADDTSIPAMIMAVYVCLLATGLLALLLRMESRYRRQALYAPAMLPAQKAFSGLADASWTVVEGDGSQASFIHNLEKSLKYLADAFSIITDTSCRAAIKVVSTGSGEVQVRDFKVVTLCRSSQQPEVDFPEPDRIGNNTDFLRIFVENENYFFCNDLPAEIGRGYQNSHWNTHVITERKFDYTATIVWPIGRVVPSDGERQGRREIIGFLCLDALATGIFQERFDIPLGAAFAQGLYLALHRFRARRAADGGAPLAIPSQRPSMETEAEASK
jgi:hypothetical protein